MSRQLAKRMGGLLACAVLAATAACSGGGKAGDGAAAGSSASPGQSAKPAESAKAPVKLVFLAPWAVYDRQTDVQKKVHDILQEKSGADLVPVFPATGETATQKVNLMLSSGEQLDIIPFQSIDRALELYKNGAIVPLNDLLDKYGSNLKKNFDADAWAEVTVDGKILGIPSLYPNRTPSILQIRTDWLKNVNLPMPVTIEDYEKVMDAFVNGDPDKNGKKDTYALNSGSQGTVEDLEKAFAPFFLKQAMNWWQDGQGNLLPPEMDPAYKDMMAKLIEWSKKGYIWPEMILSKNDKRVEAIAQNKIGSVGGWYSSTISGALEVLAKTVPEANYEPVALQGKGVNKLATTPKTQFVAVITKKSKNPENAMKFLDYTATREGYDLTTIGIEGQSYTKLSNGLVEYVGDDKTDWQKAKYYYLHNMFTMKWEGTGPWPVNSWSDITFTKMLNASSKLPSFDAVDKNVVYDKSAWKSFAKQTDMQTYLSEQKVKVFAGEVPLADWDKIMQKWKDIGGAQMIEDRTAQFKAAKK
ncbi:MAG: hypothetical protein J7639_11020 [Paenibacillaceae bacterium]|nr:hypothetical protein [Paenibacillaceae bacterium]